MKKIETKKDNRNMIYRFIREKEAVSKQDIAYGLNLSLPTVTQGLEYLLERKLIGSEGRIKNTVGRNAVAYSYLKNARVAAGLDLTLHHIRGVLVNLSGEVVYSFQERMNYERTDAYFRHVSEVLDDMLREAEISVEDDLIGVGIAMPGLVTEDSVTEKVTYGLAMDNNGLTRQDIAQYIPYHAKLYHDAGAAGYGEVWSNPKTKNAFYINLSNTVGGSVLIDNSIYEGSTQKGGEIGHLVIHPEGDRICYCGKRGCMDPYCSAQALSDYTEGDLGVFFQKLENGDEEIQNIWNQYLNDLALAITNVRMLFDSTIILGGYVGAYMQPYLEELWKRVNERNPFGDDAREYVRCARYKMETVAVGAAIFFISSFIEAIGE